VAVAATLAGGGKPGSGSLVRGLGRPWRTGCHDADAGHHGRGCQQTCPRRCELWLDAVGPQRGRILGTAGRIDVGVPDPDEDVRTRPNLRGRSTRGIGVFLDGRNGRRAAAGTAPSDDGS
jgi:hypothetical protein